MTVTLVFGVGGKLVWFAAKRWEHARVLRPRWTLGVLTGWFPLHLLVMMPTLEIHQRDSD